MKRSIFIGTALFVGLVIFLFSSELNYGQDKKGNESNGKLLKRIESLEKIVKEQQGKIETLQSEIDKIKRESPLATLPSLPGLKEGQNSFPKGAKPFNFNGQTYYMTPLNNISPDSSRSELKK